MNAADYQLAVQGKAKKSSVHSSKPVALRSPIYDPARNTVTLTPRGKIPKGTFQLTINTYNRMRRDNRSRGIQEATSWRPWCKRQRQRGQRRPGFGGMPDLAAGDGPALGMASEVKPVFHDGQQGGGARSCASLPSDHRFGDPRLRRGGPQRALDGLLDDDVRVFLLDDRRVEGAVPEVERAGEVLREQGDQRRGERVAEEDGPGQFGAGAGAFPGLGGVVGDRSGESPGPGRRDGARRANLGSIA